jgi:hypothetical protein
MLINTPTLAPYNRELIAAECARLGSERLDARQIDNLYRAMIVHRAELYGAERLDANETVILTQTLEQMRSRVVEIKRPELKARRLIPVTSEMDPGTESWAYSVWDRVGMAKVIANYSDDIPKVAVFAKKYSYTQETIALGYDWSWLDMLRAAKSGVPLKARKANAVREGFEQKIEEIGAIGIPETGVTGLLNNINVSQISAAPPVATGSTAWNGGKKTPYEILGDLQAMEDAIINTTKGVHQPDTLVLPMSRLRYIAKTPLNVLAGSNPRDTILKVYLEQSETIRNVDWWRYCDTANAGAPRAAMYRRDPTHVHLEIPLEQQEQPPQAKNLAMEIISVGRIGGVAWEYPLSAVYMNGI